MTTRTQSIGIAARPDDVFAYVADLEQLPSWAIGFAKGIRQENGRWLVTTASGEELPIRVESDRRWGTVDYFTSMTPGVEMPASTRVVPAGEGSAYVFTMVQPPDMPDEVFERQNEELGRELVVLKARLESSCPL